MTTPGWVADARESYDRVAVPYAELTRDAVTSNRPLVEAYETFAERAHATGAGSPVVVDAGCGPGWWAHLLAGRGLHAIGVDLSPEMLAVARRATSPARFVVGSLLDLPLPDAGADGVACMYVLHHVPAEDLGRAADEIVRVLRPGGALLVGGHVGDDSRLKTEGYGGLPMRVQVNRRPASLWEKLFRERGLEVDLHTDDGTAHVLHAHRPAVGAEARAR